MRSNHFVAALAVVACFSFASSAVAGGDEACCLPDGSCVVDLDSNECIDAGGSPQGTFFSCSGIVCGACCGAGTCVYTDESVCTGSFLGAASACGPLKSDETNQFDCPAPAKIDIKPGSCPNRVNRFSNGILPVALAGSESFDVTNVDVTTLLLSRADGVGGTVAPIEGPAGPHAVVNDVATPFNSADCECSDSGGDGILDLSASFRMADLADALEFASLSIGDTIELVLTGDLLDGTMFQGSDCILLAKGRNEPRR